MNSSNSATGQSPSVAPPTRSFLVLLADNSRLRVTDRDLAMQLRQERSATLKRLRQGRAEAKAQVAERIGEDRIRREFAAREREADAAIRRLSKQVRIKPEPRRTSQPARSIPSDTVHPGYSRIVHTQRTSSALARRDRLGREGIMLRIRYVRAGGKHASPGCLRRHWRYIAREAAVALDSEGQQIVLSNLGDTLDDVAAGLDVQENVLRAMRKNAKLGFRMIGAFPYGLPVDARRAVLQRIGDELFGDRGLPWTGAAHDSDAGAKVDNPHFHLDYGALPMVRQKDGSYIVSNDLRTDLDGEDGLRFIRHTVARILTEVAQEYGLDRSFTALSYRQRGMNLEGGEHVGQAGTAAHRRGENVATVARNDAKRRRNAARERAGKAREQLNALERLKQAIAAIVRAPQTVTVPILESESPLTIPPIALPAISHPVDEGITVPAPPRLIVLGTPAPSTSPVPSVLATVTSAEQIGGAALPPALTQIGSSPLMADPPISPTVGNSLPPVVTAIGPAAPVLREVPSLRKLGAALPNDPDAEHTAARIDTVIAQQKRYHETGAAAAPQPDINLAHAAAFEILRRRDEWLGKDEQGRYAVSGDALRESGLSADDLQTAIAQNALQAMARGQIARLGPLTEDTSGHSVLHLEGETFRVDNRFSRQLQDDVRRWSSSVHFRQFIERKRLVLATTPPPEAPATSDARRRTALIILFARIADERHRVGMVDGVPVVDAALLAKCRLVPADVQHGAARKRLEEFVIQQTGELSRIASYVMQAPHHIVPDGDGWLLDEDAPADVRLLASAWRRDASVQKALERLATATLSDTTKMSVEMPSADLLGVAWQRARTLRQRAMAETDEAERFDENGLVRPGRFLERPAIATVPTSSSLAARYPRSGLDR